MSSADNISIGFSADDFSYAREIEEQTKKKDQADNEKFAIDFSIDDKWEKTKIKNRNVDIITDQIMEMLLYEIYELQHGKFYGNSSS